MAVELMGDDIEKLADFRLKGEFFLRHGVSLRLLPGTGISVA